MDFSTEQLLELEKAMKEAEMYSIDDLIKHVKTTGMIYAEKGHPIAYMDISAKGIIYMELQEGYEYLSQVDTGGDSFEIYLRKKDNIHA